MKLVIIGSGTSIITPNRHAPAFLVDTPKLKLLLDCGWGAGENLARAGYVISDLDHIFISHPHADHMADLIPLLHHTLNAGQNFPQASRRKPLYLHGYKGFKKDYEGLRRMMFPERVEKYPIKIFEYLNSSRSFPGFRVRTREAQHVERYFHSVSFRLELGKRSIMYSGDTGYTQQLVKLASRVDLAILEASVSVTMFKQLGSRPNHLSAYECGLVASQAQIKRLVLAHLYDNDPPHIARQAARKNYTGPVFPAKDLQQITI